jgi:hypothetical protein
MLLAAYPFTARTGPPSLAGNVQTVLRSPADVLGSRETREWEPFTVLGTAEAVDVLFGRQHRWEPESANTSSWFRDKELSSIGDDWLSNRIADSCGRGT